LGTPSQEEPKAAQAMDREIQTPV